MRPVWKRLVLSWVPRYCIVVAIFVIYGLIYFHVISEFKSLSGVFNNFGIGAGRRTNNLNNVNSHQHSACNETPTFFSSLRYFFSSIKNSLFPDMHVDDNNFGPTSSRHSQHSEIYDRPDNDSDSSDDDSDDLAEALEDESIDYQNPDSTKENGSHAFHNAEELQQANFESFKRRQRIIQKQMKSIFIYPFAYCFVWLFPFILQATQFNYEIHHHPVYWLNVLGAFMQPFNGFVDACVFFYRERPWKNTAMKNFEKEHRQRVDNIIVNNLQRRKYSEGGESACSMANTSARIAKNSLSASSGLVDLNTYKPWRHWLNNLRLPFYQLPTQKNIAKFQDKYIGRKLSNSQKVLEQAEHRTQNDLSIPTNIANKYRQGSDDSSPTINATVDKFNQTHDFSDILNDDSDLANYRTKDVPDFKPNFGKFSFGKSNSNFLPNRKASTTLGMSRNRSSDAHDPNSIAGRRSSSFAGGNGNSTVSTPHRVVNSPSSSTFTPINDKSIDKDELSPSENIDEEEGELDFMEFLKKGPPV
ncbi:hypothetical protein G210_3354 [Candida maltosa Xu316]|uniref:G protein-coupled receptor GPR1 C-terminal domain-containing protein n=1 Tax=Candida maltosa (strain Xu316) TaxID=1245528 RepID=M3JVI8_CANMX|nr:hypothetical protein G210_3354 [Candida maltosa Xu316]